MKHRSYELVGICDIFYVCISVNTDEKWGGFSQKFGKDVQCNRDHQVYFDDYAVHCF